MKKLRFFLIICGFSLLCLFFPIDSKAKTIIPALPIDSSYPYVISVQFIESANIKKLYLTYCKDSSYVLRSRSSNYQELGYCYDSNGTQRGFAYRRSLDFANSNITIDDIWSHNANFGSYTWGNEVNGYSYGTVIYYNSNTGKLWNIQSGQDSYESLVSSSTLSIALDTNTNIFDYLGENIILSESDVSGGRLFCNSSDDFRQLGKIYGLNTFNFVASKTIKFPDNIDELEQYSLDGVFSFTFSDKLSPLPSDPDFTVTHNNLTDENLVISQDFDCVDNTCFIEYHISTTSVEPILAKVEFVVSYNGINTIPAMTLNSCPIVDVNNYYTYSDDITGNGSILNSLNNNNIDFSVFGNISSWLPSGPVDSILTIPLQMLNALTSALNGQCSPLVITLPFVNSNITLPCINTFYNNIGISSFFNWVGVLVSTIILIQYFTFLYNWIDNVLRLGHQKIKVWGVGGL